METEDDGPRAPSGAWSAVSAVPGDIPQESEVVTPTSPAPDAWIGRVIAGRFRIVEPIGEGGMAVVYRAQETGIIRRDVAIKLLSPESAMSQGILARFLKEAQIIADIRHPNVVQVIDVGRTDDGHLYLAMELLEGHSLQFEIRQATLRGEVFSWERAASIALQICAALQAAHRRGVVHRDIKPNNCFCIDVDGSRDFIKLLDFGIAKAQIGGSSDDSLATPLTQQGMFLGTPHYAAPEVITQEPSWPIDGRADIFALGVMLYQMLTGSLPFQGASKIGVMYKTVHERPPSPRARAPEHNIPVEVDALVMKAMAIDPRERFTGVAAMAEAIRATLHLRATTLPPMDSGSGRSGGVLVSGSIVELGAPTPVDHQAAVSRQQPAKRVSVRVLSLEGDGTPPPPGQPKIVQDVQAATLAEALAPGGEKSLGELAAILAMAVALMALIALLVHEFGSGSVAVAPPWSSSSTQPTLSPAQPSGVPVPPPPLPAVLQPVADPEQLAPLIEDVIPGGSAALVVDPVPGASGPTEEDGPSKDLQAARKQQVRDRIRGLAQGDEILRCLPDTVLLADGVPDQLAVVIMVDSQGRPRATVQARGVKRRIPKSADPCILKLIAELRFPPADAAVAVPVTLNLD